VALGKGLGEILAEVGQAYESDLDHGGRWGDEEANERVEEIAVERIDPNPYQPRKHFDPERLAELAESIRKHGLLQPIVVVPNGDRYLLVAGERRLRAHQLAQLPTIRAIVAPVDLDDVRMRELALVENIQRENLNPIELARAYHELLEVHNITHEGLARIVHKSRSQITNTLRLLSLSPTAQQKLIEGKITQGHAKMLAGLEPERERVVLDTILGQKLSVRETERLLKRPAASSSRRSGRAGTPIDPTLRKRLERVLPFEHSLRGSKLEIVLPNEEDLIKFITLLEKK
jgi:ParB family chromosome partitioning protein